jgi:hypothetical protein
VTARRLVRPIALGALAGYLILASSSDVFAAPVARQVGPPVITSACATRPKAAVLEDTTFTPTASPTPSGGSSVSSSAKPTASAKPTPRPTGTSTSTSTASPKPTATSSSPSPKPTATHTATESPTSKPTVTPTKTASPKPSRSASPSPSPSSSAPVTPQLCVSVQSLATSAQVRAGHDAGFVVWVWSTKGTSKAVTVGLRIAKARHVKAPHFTVCPSSTSGTCSIGTLPAGQADELQATAFVQKAATAGEQVQLTATASGSRARSDDAAGSVVVTAAASPTPTTSTTPPPASGITLPPVALLPTSGADAGLGDPTSLFPTVSPSPSTSSPGTSGGSGLGFPRPKKQATARLATTSAIVPLDPRLIGGQLAGLAVLAGAFAIAIARLSLRKPRPQDGPDSQSTGKKSPTDT